MSNTQLLGGLAGAIGSDFVATQNRLLFVEYGGRLSKYDLAPTMSILHQGTAVLKGTFSIDLETGVQQVSGPPLPGADIFWEQDTAVVRRMTPIQGASIVNIGVTDFAAIPAQALLGLPYASTSIDGNNDATNQLVTGDVFAVKTGQGHYAVVLVTAYGYDMSIQWVTYQAAAAYGVLGTGYQQPEDVAASADGLHAYVVERSGDLVKVALANANRSAASVISSGMNTPQQLALDEAHGSAYVVEYASPGRLLKINLSNGAQTTLLSGLAFPVGLAMSSDGQTAYVAEQGAGSGPGTVSRYALPGGAKTVLASGLSQPFFLTWSDDTGTTLFVTQRAGTNSVLAIGAAAPATPTVVTSGLPALPSCVAVIHPGQLIVTTDQTLQSVSVGLSLSAGAPLVAGIGFVPFNYITAAGYADTSSDPGAILSVTNAPFAGSLPVMVNFLEAIAVGAAYYQVVTNGTDIRTDQYNTYYAYNGVDYSPRVFGTQTIGGQPYYVVPNLTELALWYPGLVGCYLDSTTLNSGQTSTIAVNFFNSSMTPMTFTPPLATMAVFVDNYPTKAGISMPVLNGVSATTACGYLAYKPATATSDLVTIAFTASQPLNNANYSFDVIKGIGLVPGSSLGGPVTPPPAPFTDTVSGLLGTCVIAGFAANVYVAATAINGWGRASWLDSSAEVAFVLAPGA